MVYTFRFFSSKCSLFHNSNVFGSCIIHTLYTECAKIKKNNSGAKRLNNEINPYYYSCVFMTDIYLAIRDIPCPLCNKYRFCVQQRLPLDPVHLMQIYHKTEKKFLHFYYK